MRSRDRVKWLAAMNEEMKSLEVNNIWVLVKKPNKSRLAECRWLIKLNDSMTADESPRYKASLVAMGYTQREGIDFNEVFPPVVKFKTIRLVLVVVAITCS